MTIVTKTTGPNGDAPNHGPAIATAVAAVVKPAATTEDKAAALTELSTIVADTPAGDLPDTLAAVIVAASSAAATTDTEDGAK